MPYKNNFTNYLIKISGKPVAYLLRYSTDVEEEIEYGMVFKLVLGEIVAKRAENLSRLFHITRSTRLENFAVTAADLGEVGEILPRESLRRVVRIDDVLLDDR